MDELHQITELLIERETIDKDQFERLLAGEAPGQRLRRAGARRSRSPSAEPERKPRTDPKPRPFPLPGATMQPPEPEAARHVAPLRARRTICGMRRSLSSVLVASRRRGLRADPAGRRCTVVRTRHGDRDGDADGDRDRRTVTETTSVGLPAPVAETHAALLAAAELRRLRAAAAAHPGDEFSYTFGLPAEGGPIAYWQQVEDGHRTSARSSILARILAPALHALAAARTSGPSPTTSSPAT